MTKIFQKAYAFALSQLNPEISQVNLQISVLSLRLSINKFSLKNLFYTDVCLKSYRNNGKAVISFSN